MDDTTLHAIIMDAVNNYTEPKYRKPQTADYDLNCHMEQSHITPHDKEGISRHQKEYGERKRIKP
jgi:hypothetical protein